MSGEAPRAGDGPPRMRLPNGLAVAHVSADETAALYREIFTERRYLQHGVSLSPGGVVFDVGANIGMSTLFFHTECAGLRFHAFEPAPVPYAALAANVAGHSIDATISRCAISDHSGTGRMTYYPNTTVMSGFHADPASDAAVTRAFLERMGLGSEAIDGVLTGKYETTTIKCPVRTLSEVIAEREITSIDLLKIDVEKSELAVLRGLDDADWPRVRQIVAEVHDLDDALKSFLSLVEQHGFTVTLGQDTMLAGSEIFDVFAIRT